MVIYSSKNAYIVANKSFARCEVRGFTYSRSFAFWLDFDGKISFSAFIPERQDNGNFTVSTQRHLRKAIDFLNREYNLNVPYIKGNETSETYLELIGGKWANENATV